MSKSPNDNIPKWVWERRLRTARKVREILCGNRVIHSASCTECGGSWEGKTCGLAHATWWTRVNNERSARWTWALILGHFVGAGRLTYREVIKVARGLKDRFGDYPDHQTRLTDEPYRRAFLEALIAFDDGLGKEERYRRKREFLLTLTQGRRKMIATEALFKQRCPLCYEPLPCTTHQLGRVRYVNHRFEEIA